MRVASIYLRGARGGSAEAAREVVCGYGAAAMREAGGCYTDAAYAAVGLGIGDEPPRKAGRELSLIAAEELPHIRTARGLCTDRFHADVATEGLCYTSLQVGDRLRLGGAEIEISAVGKRCFDECPIRARGERCPLPGSCAFARVVAGGEVRVGDDITVLRGAGERHE